MSKGRHRKPGNWRLKYLSGLTVLVLVVIAACASAQPSPVQANEVPKSSDWKPSTVQGVEYACDPAIGLLIHHKGEQIGAGNSESYKLWSLSVIPVSELTGSQLRELCGRGE